MRAISRIESEIQYTLHCIRFILSMTNAKQQTFSSLNISGKQYQYNRIAHLNYYTLLRYFLNMISISSICSLPMHRNETKQKKNSAVGNVICIRLQTTRICFPTISLSWTYNLMFVPHTRSNICDIAKQLTISEGNMHNAHVREFMELIKLIGPRYL